MDITTGTLYLQCCEQYKGICSRGICNKEQLVRSRWQEAIKRESILNKVKQIIPEG